MIEGNDGLKETMDWRK